MTYLTANEFAARFKLHVKTVYAKGRDGTLETIYFGRTVRFALPEPPRVRVSNEARAILER